MPTRRISDIALRVGGEILGQNDLAITGVEQLELAQPGHITFVRDGRFIERWQKSHASAALVGPEITSDPETGKAFIRVPDTDLAMVVVLELFAPPAPRPTPGIHPSAIIDPTAVIDPSAAVGPCCVIGARVQVGANAILHANVIILDEAVIGKNCELWPGVVIRDRCILGDRCILHPNVVIGADGFGYRPAPGGKGLVKIPHIGYVRIGNDVEIGANSAVDRGKFSATVIGDGTKIDNLCQIAHNCQIGRSCIIAAQVGIAGSTILGDGVMMGGQAAARDNIIIGAGARIAACSAAAWDVPAGADFAGTPAQDARSVWREISALRKLPDIMKSLKAAARQAAATPGTAGKTKEPE